MDENGNYVDNIPPKNSKMFRYGLRCQCGTRKDKVFYETSKFNVHTKTKTHQKWLEQFNINKMNYVIECIKQKETIKNQQ